MRILFAIQGTGNGHLSRAAQIYPFLRAYGQIDVLVSGTEHTLKPSFPVRFHYKGLGFAFGHKGGINYIKTYRDARIWKFLKSVDEVPVRNYDLIINDFEPITAWACRLREVPIVALSHQSALIKPGVPKPATPDLAADMVLRYYAPAAESVGFHFESYHHNIFTPVIRQELYLIRPKQCNHLTVYLPAYAVDQLSQILPVIKGMKWQIFARVRHRMELRPDISVFPVDSQSFVKSMSSSSGVLCGAGFETPAEAFHLGIPLLVVPMRGQYEQECNAAAIEKIGAKVIWKSSAFDAASITQWVEERKKIQLEYPNIIKPALERVMELYKNQPATPASQWPGLKSLLAG
ncbi:MAG TPA: glycosyltransferase family protein [Bacteroidales bacterium]|nr:glycosyltransferase family protein [Bacteroidales bacterium]